jgi:hypothetical protein
VDQRSLLMSSLDSLTGGLRPTASATDAALSDARAAIVRSVLAGRQPTSPGYALHAAFPADITPASDIAPVVDRVLQEPVTTTPPMAFVRDLPCCAPRHSEERRTQLQHGGHP